MVGSTQRTTPVRRRGFIGKHTHVYASCRRAGQNAALTVIDKNVEVKRLDPSEGGELRRHVVQSASSRSILRPDDWLLAPVQRYEAYPAEINVEVSFQRGSVERLVDEKPNLMAPAQVLGQRERPLLTTASGLHAQVNDSDLHFHRA